MSVRSRSQAVGVAPAGVAPTGVGLESRLAQVLTVGQRTFGPQTDATGVKPGVSGREKREQLPEQNHAAFKKRGSKSALARQLARASRAWDDDDDTWTPVIRIENFGSISSLADGFSWFCTVTLTWEKTEGRLTSLAEAVAEVLKEWLSCEKQDGGYGIAGAGAPTVMSKDPNGPPTLKEVDIGAHADVDANDGMLPVSLVAEIVKLIDPNAPVALAPGYFDNVEKSDFLPCFEEVVVNEYPSSESGSESEEEEEFQELAKKERKQEAEYNAFMSAQSAKN